MKIYHGINSYKKIKNNTVVALGMFDGIHLGHKKIIKHAQKIAKDIAGELLLITFNTHPKHLFSPMKKDYLLTTNEEKIYILKKLGVNSILFLNFDIKTANMSAENFLKKDILEKINPQTIVVGKNFRFGKDKQGDIHLISKHSNLASIEEIKKNKQKISSTNIRELLRQGNIKETNELLGHTYFIKNQIIHGFGLATRFGVSTANIHIPKFKLLPEGVFKGYTQINNSNHLSAISIGLRHTLDRHKEKLCCESHLIDFKKNIYHQNIILELKEKIRDQQKFNSLTQLFDQVKKDIIKIKS
ncbi:MAG: bifunctional riboflavin kinase/FAD synthetase [bacterium]|nr:bifunctional riboflavin kinase/FAD synthetase [bacterium]